MGQGFEGFILFGFLSALLLIGVFLRARVKIFQKFLVPASIIGGLLGFVLVALCNAFGPVGPDGVKQSLLSIGGISITHIDFNPFVFHTFNISFMSLLLTPAREGAKTIPGNIVKGGLWESFIWSISLTAQALIGGMIIWIYNILTGGELSQFVGYIATHGYTQGPGQAFVMGTLWEKTGGIPDIINIGLIYSGMGFFSAVLIGVPLARWFVNRDLNTNTKARIGTQFLQGLFRHNAPTSNGRETTHPANIDTFCFHLAIIGLTYLLTYIELSWLEAHVKPLFASSKYFQGLAIFCSLPMFFVHGLIVGLIVRKTMEKLGVAHLLDPVVQNRITGTSVDFLVIATLVAIKFSVLANYALPIFFVSLGITLFTLLLVLYFGRHLSNYGPERTVTMFGCCCGSTASGLLLLRILDPDYSTPVAIELGFYNIAILVTNAVTLFFIAPALFTFSTMQITLIYGGMTLFYVMMIFVCKLYTRQKAW